MIDKKTIQVAYSGQPMTLKDFEDFIAAISERDQKPTKPQVMIMGPGWITQDSDANFLLIYEAWLLGAIKIAYTDQKQAEYYNQKMKDRINKIIVK